MCSFYRKHIQNFSQVATPLSNLTKKDVSFEWTSDCQQAFEKIKEKMTQAPVLVKADLSLISS